MKRLLLVSLLAIGVLAPGSVHAAVPCRDKIYNDWYGDGKIASTYPLGCYHDALAHMPADATIYSSLSTDIRSALQAAIARRNGRRVPIEVGKGLPSSAANSLATVDTTTSAPHDPTRPTDPVVSQDPTSRPSRSVSTVDTAAQSSATGGGSMPTPILILGGVALALVAAGGAGAAVRYGRRRGFRFR